MSRRPITKEGYEVLIKELKHLKLRERPKVIQDLAAARAHGDLSENAEYDAAKERQAYIEGKISDLESRLSMAEIIDLATLPRDKVAFGAKVVVQYRYRRRGAVPARRAGRVECGAAEDIRLFTIG